MTKRDDISSRLSIREVYKNIIICWLAINWTILLLGHRVLQAPAKILEIYQIIHGWAHNILCNQRRPTMRLVLGSHFYDVHETRDDSFEMHTRIPGKPAPSKCHADDSLAWDLDDYAGISRRGESFSRRRESNFLKFCERDAWDINIDDRVQEDFPMRCLTAIPTKRERTKRIPSETKYALMRIYYLFIY